MLHHRWHRNIVAFRCHRYHPQTLGQSHAYYQAYGEDDLSRGAVAVAARQAAYHQAVGVADAHQNCHCLVVAAACLDA